MTYLLEVVEEGEYEDCRYLYKADLFRRLLFPSTAIRRTIIRHLVLVLDLSQSMLDRDMRPTRFDLMLEYSRAFIVEWFDQNPLGQIGIVGLRSGIAERICEMSGKYVAHLVRR